MALFIAVETFITERRGRSEIVRAGEVAGGKSWPVGLHPGAFRPLEIRWPDEPDGDAAKPAPKPEAGSGGEGVSVSQTGDQKPVSPASLKHRGGGRGMSQPT